MSKEYLFIMSCTPILIILIWVKISLHRKIQKHNMGRIKLLAQNKTRHSQEFTILFISYSSSHFKELDDKLISYSAPLLIFFDGPEWLFNIKKKSWEKHEVLLHNPNQFDSKIFKNLLVIYRKNKKNFSYVLNPMHFLNIKTLED